MFHVCFFPINVNLSMLFIFFTEETQKQEKGFLDLLKIPRSLLLFIPNIVCFTTATSRIAGISRFLNLEVLNNYIK